MANSDLISNRSILIAAGIGTAAAVVVSSLILYQRRNKHVEPKEWICVGEITEIISYPIKSCGPIRYSNVNCTVIGIEKDNLYDRTFMVTDLERNFITARRYPEMVTILPTIRDNKLLINAPNMPEITIDISKLSKKQKTTNTIWSQEIDVIDCGDEVATWLSEFLLHEKTGIRLVYYPFKKATRPISKENKTKFPEFYTAKDVGALQDESSYMVFNQSSHDDLNSRIEHPIPIVQFRPNFIVKGPKPFEEDSWKWVRIGDDVCLKYVRPCARCNFTQITPEGKKREDGEPLKTLREYRLKPITGNSPILGVHFGLWRAGYVKVGDPVYVPKEL